MADKLKNLLLVVLLVLMGVLLVLTFWVSAWGTNGQQRLLQTMDDSDISTDSAQVAAAQPETLALLGENGLYLAEDRKEYTLLYQQAEPLYQEAMGSAGALQSVDEAEYLRLLQAPAALLQYHASQPIYLLQAWGGSETLREGLEVRGAALAKEDEGVVLLLTDREGNHWKAPSAASLTDLEALCANVTQSNAVLAENSRALAGDEVLTTQVGSFAVQTVSEAAMVRRGELSRSVQSLFGMNAYLTRVYPEADGSLVYVEGHNTVTLSPNGDLTYSGAVALEVSASDELERQVEICRQVYDLLLRLWQQAGASGQLSLEELQLENGSGMLHFGLHLDGIFLERRQGAWATVTVENGSITGVTASLRLLEAGETVQLLPGYQAATVLPQGRAWLRVRLLEQADGTMMPQRCRVTEG